MNDMLVLRRADGELFTEEINGKQVIPLWSSAEEVARYIGTQPEARYFPAYSVDRRAKEQIEVNRRHGN